MCCSSAEIPDRDTVSQQGIAVQEKIHRNVPRHVLVVIQKRSRTIKKSPGPVSTIPVIQFLLSSRLYCRFWNFTKSAAQRRSRTIPPVGNFTPPRRTIFICSITEYHIFICCAIIFYPCKFPLSGNVHRNVLLPFRREAPPSR